MGYDVRRKSSRKMGLSENAIASGFGLKMSDLGANPIFRHASSSIGRGSVPNETLVLRLQASPSFLASMIIISTKL